MTISELLCRQFSFSRAELFAYAQTCPHRYKTYPIDKRNSDKKRIISQPSKDLKAVQRFILSEFLSSKLSVHDAAKAYKVETNILDNAKPHLKNRYLLKMDFRDFFPSIRAWDFVQYLVGKDLVKDDIEAKLLARIFFKNQDGELLLSIGSPGSPIISNALLFPFDEKVSDLCREAGVSYTRYSDDLTFSTNNRDLLFSWVAKIENILEELKTPTLELNHEKTVFSSKKFNRHVTGITITNDGLASIGRGKKRALRSRVFNAPSSSMEEIASLRGYISFANQIESDLVRKLWEKYPEQMRVIMK